MSNKILKFGAEWCAPCGHMKRLLEAANLGIKIEEVDIDEVSRAVLSEYDVRSVPTLVFLKDDVMVGKLIGMHTIDEVKEFVDTHS